jgi:hypothetical protein
MSGMLILRTISLIALAAIAITFVDWLSSSTAPPVLHFALVESHGGLGAYCGHDN